MFPSFDYATLSGRYSLGIIFILICAVIWAGASVLIQYIYEDLDFRSPFFLTYMATSLLAFHLPAYAGHHFLKRKIEDYQSESDNLSSAYTPVESNECDQAGDNGLIHRYLSFIPRKHREVIQIAMIISPLWFGANCFYNYSLLLTSVSSSTIISNLSASFTLAFSWWLGIEDASYTKILGILICFAGAVSVGLQDDSSNDDNSGSVGGDVMAVIGSVGYGLYTTAMRYKVPDDSQISMQLLLGYIGLINAILLTPALITMFLLRLGNVQDITAEVAGFITLNGFADTVIADYFWARAVILTSPTVATIGMSVTIPIAIMTDYIIKGVEASWVSVIGAVLVIIGFILVNLAPEAVDRFLGAMRDYIVRTLCGETNNPSSASLEVMKEKGSRDYEQISPLSQSSD